MIDVQTSDGVILKATVFSAGKPGPAVLLLHQCDEQRNVWDSLGMKLARAGMTAMSIDYRGYGESGGMAHDKLTPDEFNAQTDNQWPIDVDSAFKVLLREPGVEPSQIGAAGASCGVQVALQLAERWHDIRALALLAGPIDQRGRSFISKDSAPPIFLGAAADDKYANFVDIQSWYSALSSNKQTRVIEYPNGGHAAIVFRAHPDFADTITKWFSAVLRGNADQLPTTNGHTMRVEVLQVLRDVDRPGGAARVAETLMAARKQNAAVQLFPEYYVNQLGYDHMLAKDFAGAIEIMKLNTIAYPNSPDTYDGLGDVYFAAGDTARMVEAAKRTLAVLAKDTVDTAERKQKIQDSAVAKLKNVIPHR
ncbi:MAG: dienelactone hydrolase family protein [Gemmatimonas sp.]